MNRTTVLGVVGAAAGLLVALTVAAVALPRAGTGIAPPASAAAVPAEHRAHETVVSRRPDATAPRTAADALVRATRRNAHRWAEVDDARRAGYRSIGDGVTGFEHYVHPRRLTDAAVLDARRPESLVYEVDGQRRTLVSAMYILEPGATLADVPELGDQRAQWHRHRDLCWDADGTIAGLFRNGRCVPAGIRVVTPPMLHVWVTPHPCGPFAGLEGHGTACH